MTDNSVGVGGVSFDHSKKHWPQEMNVLIALVVLIAAFEALGRLFIGSSFLFNSSATWGDFFTGLGDGSQLVSDPWGYLGNIFSLMFNSLRLQIMILQVAIVGIIAIGVTQVIISGGIDISSGSVLGATAMITMAFAQKAMVNGSLNPTAAFSIPWLFDLPVIVPILIALACGAIAGLINGAVIAYTRISPLIATLAMMSAGRGVSVAITRGKPMSFPTDSYIGIGEGMRPVLIFIVLAIIFQLVLNHTKYGKHCYAIGSNEEAARVSGINIEGHKILVYIIAGMLAAVAALVVTSKNLTAQASMGTNYELQAITMAVIGGVSLLGGRGSVIGSVLGALILGVVITGFTFLKLDAFFQPIIIWPILVGAAALDVWRQRSRGR